MDERYQIISVIGLGYIGLPTAALLASIGYTVHGVDVDEETVAAINSGEVNTLETNLNELVKSVVKNKKLKAHFEVQPADVYIICVPTPFQRTNVIPSPNLDHVRAAAESISTHVKEDDIVILESTSPVGTTEMIQEVLEKSAVQTSKLFFAYCPERVLPGNIMFELVNNPRVIGGLTQKSTEKVSRFYKTFVSGDILQTDAKTAEMCKLTENSFRDVNIAFANELSIICEANGVNVWDLIELANCHPRVNVLKPSTGVGGHCIAVDPWFIVSSDPDNARLIKTARTVNDQKPEWVANKIKNVAEAKRERKILVLGLTFKPNIDDLRGSPAVRVVKLLDQQGYEVYCLEPNIKNHPDFKLIDIESLDQFEIIALLVEHDEFTSGPIHDVLNRKNVINFCSGTFG